MTSEVKAWLKLTRRHHLGRDTRAAESAVAKGKNVPCEAVTVRDDEAVWRLFVHLQRATRYELGRLLRSLFERIDLIPVAVDDQRRHGDRAHVGAEVTARNGAHTLDGGFRRGAHELRDHPLGHGRRDGGMTSSEGGNAAGEESRAVLLQAGDESVEKAAVWLGRERAHHHKPLN